MMSIAGKIRHPLRVARSWREERLRLSEVRTIWPEVAGVLERSRDEPRDPEEQDWVRRIEVRRRLLEARTDQISYTDFGAGAARVGGGGTVTRVVGEQTRVSSKSYRWCLFLFQLIRAFRPGSCLELGTSVGISASYQGAALSLNRQGSLVTLEGSPPLARIAQEGFEELGLTNVSVVTGPFEETLDGVLGDQAPIDFAFIDGNHVKEATIHYFEKVCAVASPSAILIFDDIRWSDGMKAAWRSISNDARVDLAVDLGALGACRLSS
jgi:predicted O-methyltransferase YrrM